MTAATRRAPRPVQPAATTLGRAGAVAWQLLGIAAAVLVAGWAAGRLMPVLLPLGVALLLSTLLRPIAARLIALGIRPGLAAFASVLAGVLTLAAMLVLVVPPFVSRLGALGTNVQDGVRRVAYELGREIGGMSHAAVDRAIDQAAGRLREHLGGLAGDAVAGATAVVTALAAAVLIVFLCFFLVKDGPRIANWLTGLAPEPRRAALREVGRRAWSALGTYARGILVVATFDAVFIGIALLVVGVPLALPLIVMTWLGAFFPIVGALVASTAAVLVALVANGLSSALVVLAAIVAVQQIEAHVLYPVVVGPRLRLHPLTVLLAVAVGGTIAGIAGAFLAVPAATVAATVLEYVREDRP